MERLEDYHSPVLNEVETVIEMAARRHYGTVILPGVHDWDQLVARGDQRIDIWRSAMMLALKEILVIPADWRPENWSVTAF